MKSFKNTLAGTQLQAGNRRRRARGQGAVLEAFEPRTLLSTLYVVGEATPRDASHFRLITDALSAAVAGDTVQIEPGSFAAPGPLTISQSITVQGDPSVPQTSIPPLTLTIAADGVKLNDLSITAVTVNGGVNNLTLEHSRVGIVTETAAATGNGTNTYLDDDFSGELVIRGNTQTGVTTNDVVDNNRFYSAQPRELDLAHADGTSIVDNSVQGAALTQVGIAVDSSQNVTINDNVVHLGLEGPGSSGTTDIQVTNSDSAATSVKISNNSLSTNNHGTGIALTITAGANFSATIEGNDFHQSFTGIAITGDGTATPTALGTVDIGGGGTSRGGNNFRGFDGSTANSLAIVATNNSVATGDTISALNDMFAVGVSPATQIKDSSNGGAGTLSLTTELDTDHAFIQALYHQFLGRTGSLAELSTWVSALPTLGRSAVVNAIGRSAEAYRRVVDKVYLNYLGRHADSSGLAFWVNLLQTGGTLENLRNGILSSGEYAARINVDYVQSLYMRLLERVATAGELAWWNNVELSHSDIAAGFLHSDEYRGDAVGDFYSSMLRRSASAAEIAAWVHSGVDLYSIELAIAASAEFAQVG